MDRRSFLSMLIVPFLRSESTCPYGSLFGLPVVPVERFRGLGTDGDIVLADFSQYVGKK